MNADPKKLFCAAINQKEQRPVFGSAPEANIWFLLEYNNPWGSKVLVQSTLSAELKTLLQSWVDNTPRSKLLFIKRGQKQNIDKLSFFIVIGQADKQLIFQFKLDNYEHLAQIDPAKIILNPEQFIDHTIDSPLVLVCTNGKRDKCCAKYGLPLFKTMQHYYEDIVWQCSHFGGHKYAPTFLYLPEGLCYGHVAMSDCDTILDACIAGSIELANYRGRSCYRKIEQAADYFLRMHTGRVNLNDYRLLKTESLGDNRWEVKFEDTEDASIYSVKLSGEKTGAPVLASCTKMKMEPPMTYVNLGIQSSQE